MDFSAITSNASDSNDGIHPHDKRRSSARSIKRRRFDDELVESSIGIPGASVGKGEKRIRTQSSNIFGENSQHLSPSPVPMAGGAERRRSSAKAIAPSGSKKARRKGQLSQLSTKDLGRWKPTDDLALIIGVQQTNDLRTVHRGIKFSCRFTLSELQARWYALLYNPEVSRIAVAAMGNLHPDLVAMVHEQALYSVAEEELLGTLASNSRPTLEKFQELLEANPQVLYQSRTAKSLMNHWQLLKQYQLLPDQVVKPLNKVDNLMTFSEAEDSLNDAELQEPRDEVVDVEMTLADRVEKKEIRLLETTLSRWQVLVQSVAGGSTELDRNTLAVLRGRLVRYLMRSREIAVGRSTKDHTVDVDLTLEGPAAKVSRRQGTIRLRNNGDFFMSSEGKRPVFVDGKPILQGNKVKLNHNSVVEIAGLRFIFLVNQDLINAIRQESIKVNL